MAISGTDPRGYGAAIRAALLRVKPALVEDKKSARAHKDRLLALALLKPTNFKCSIQDVRNDG